MESDKIKLSSLLDFACKIAECKWYRLTVSFGDWAEGEVSEIGDYPLYLGGSPVHGAECPMDSVWNCRPGRVGMLHWRSLSPLHLSKEASSRVQFIRGLGLDGLSFRFDGDGGASGVLSFLTDSEIEDRQAEKINTTITSFLPFVANCIEPLRGKPSCEFLSDRELEVLHWVAYGKTSWEISQILKLSERTVNFHIANCVDKLDAANRSHAAVKAVLIGAISF